MEKFIKVLDTINRTALHTVMILLPWLAPIPSAVFIAVAAHDILKAGWITSILIGVFLDGFGIVSVALWSKLNEYNSQRLESEPVANIKHARILVGAYVLSALWLTVFLKIAPVITELNPNWAWIEKVLLSVSYAIFPLVTLSGAAALSLNSQHSELLARIAKEREAKELQAKKLAEKEARHTARVEREAAKVAQLEKKVAQKIPDVMPVAVPDEYNGMISKKLAGDPRYMKFFLEQVGRNGKGLMPVEEIMQLTGVPKKTAYNYAGYFKRDTKKES